MKGILGFLVAFVATIQNFAVASSDLSFYWESKQVGEEVIFVEDAKEAATKPPVIAPVMRYSNEKCHGAITFNQGPLKSGVTLKEHAKYMVNRFMPLCGGSLSKVSDNEFEVECKEQNTKIYVVGDNQKNLNNYRFFMVNYADNSEACVDEFDDYAKETRIKSEPKNPKEEGFMNKVLTWLIE